jgi:hypothetical protein
MVSGIPLYQHLLIIAVCCAALIYILTPGRTRAKSVLAVLAAACLGGAACHHKVGCGKVRDSEISDQVHPVDIYYSGSRCELIQTSGSPPVFRASGEALYFLGTKNGRDTGIWISDGTASGTRLLVSSAVYGQRVNEILPLAGGALFTMQAECWAGLWQSNPRLPLWWTDDRGNSEILLDGYAVRKMASTGDTVFFKTDATNGTQTTLWVAEVRTRQVRQIASFENITALLAIPGPGLFLAARRAGDPWTLWYSDGTAEGTHGLTLVDIPLDSLDSGFAAVGRRAFFRRALFLSGSVRRELWTSDGTPAGTGPVPGAPATDEGQPYAVSELGGKLVFFFRPHPGESAGELWITDGTANTQRLAAFDEVDTSRTSIPRMVYGGRLFFFIGKELWRSDGTPAGTAPILTLPPPADAPDADPRFLGALDGTLLVVVGLADVWRVDGDAQRVAIDPKVSAVYPSAAAPSRIYYSASLSEPGSLATLRALTCEE